MCMYIFKSIFTSLSPSISNLYNYPNIYLYCYHNLHHLHLRHPPLPIPSLAQFNQPLEGQSLLSFLKSQDFKTCAELDKVHVSSRVTSYFIDYVIPLYDEHLSI